MTEPGIPSLKEVRKTLQRLKRAGHRWDDISLTLFNRGGSYGYKVAVGKIAPSKKALRYYRDWRTLDEGSQSEANDALCEAVWDYLREGREYSTTSQEMADYFLVPANKIRTACAVLNNKGYPVGSWQGGYYKIVRRVEKVENILRWLKLERKLRQKRINLQRVKIQKAY